ncbi:complex I intermediate-associated protein 30, mitochondrial-like [Babylonia areolata]|uniref:complex I intermediate-associated protein 30, mitochondrial-like n=1 Tax=Babylonia areolata TaxID=304850 RepID=UPI003FD2A825
MAHQFLQQASNKLWLSRTCWPLFQRTSMKAEQCGPFKMQTAHMGVWERDRKAGYRKPIDTPKIKLVKDGVKMIGSEMALWYEEVKEKFMVDQNVFDIQHGDYEYVWKFHDRKSVEEWKVTTDQDNNEGFSKANFTFSKNNTGLFHGHLSQKVPKDGIVKRTGYCNIRSPTKFLSFKRQDVHEWTVFTHLLLKVRGDGRPYMLTITIDRFFDVNWNDQYHYTLFTRGGPYWQVAKIPFSKFFVTSKGRIQDKQEPVQLEKVTHVGISIGDGNEGPFYLEIDSIAVMVDESHNEVFAYESYEADPAHVNT